MRILALNTGSTSTKIAVYEDLNPILLESIDHSQEDLKPYGKVIDQYAYRKEVVLATLDHHGFSLASLNAVVGRGGMLPPVKSGAYIVNGTMIARLKGDTIPEHASNLAAIIAYEIAAPLKLEAYIYDSVAVDEMIDIARYSGMPAIPRASFSHVLNSRAMAHKYAESIGKKYGDLNLVIAHLGGGISVNAHQRGRMIDIIADDEGPFSPERAGRVPCNALIELCFSGQYDKATLKKMLRGKGGLSAYLGTIDAREVASRILGGDTVAREVFESMAYQVSKGIGEMATVLRGKVDAIILTGGIAHSKLLTDWIVERTEFLAPVVILPGENEMESLAYGIRRVLLGEETASDYVE